MTDSPRFRFRLPRWGWFVMTVVVLMVGYFGMSIWLPYQREPQIVKGLEDRGDQAEADEASFSGSKPLDTSSDFDLIELVLLDLMNFNEFSPMTGVDGKMSRVILDNKTCKSFGFISDDQLKGELYPENDNPVPPDISADLRRRNPKESLPLSEFKPKNPRILIEDLSSIARQLDYGRAFEKKYPDAKGYVEAWLPGYSTDGKSAVVRMFFGPTPHGATATYMLVKHDGHWTVKWRRTAYYL